MLGKFKVKIWPPVYLIWDLLFRALPQNSKLIVTMLLAPSNLF